MKKLERAKELISNSEKLGGLIEEHNKKLENPSCDKHGLVFGGDSRFSVFKVDVFLDCHHGYYGDSSCSVLTRVDHEIAKRALNRVLNKNMSLILSEMSELIRKDAAKNVKEAAEELDEAYEFLNGIREGVSHDQ